MPLRSPCIGCESTADRRVCSRDCKAREQYADAVEGSQPLSELVVPRRRCVGESAAGAACDFVAAE